MLQNNGRNFCLQFFVVAQLLSCANKQLENDDARSLHQFENKVNELLAKGNQVYAQKNGFESFANALVYFDLANNIALESGDSMLIGECIFAKGRVYDAWNKEPQKTIALFSEAAAIYSKIPNEYVTGKYIQHLVAHAYDKINDSTNTCIILNQLYQEFLPKSDSMKRALPFIPEMALIATQVKNYELAENILNNLYSRNWIANDSVTYNYLDHYYLTKSRIAIFKNGKKSTTYLDSLEQVLKKTKNPIDSMYYSDELAILFEKAGNFNKALFYQKVNKEINAAINNSESISSMQNKILSIDVLKLEAEQEVQTQKRKFWTIIIFILSITIGGILILLKRIFNQKQNLEKQTVELEALNKNLDTKVSEIAILNKEMQHRIKNNLQTVFSLLHMQERKTENEETLAELQQARLRIESIAVLHEHLIIGGNSDQVQMNTFITTIVNKAVECFDNDYKIVTHLNIENITLTLEQKFPIGLIINELVTNSLKYAKPLGDIISLELTLKQLPDEIVLEYKDNGVSTINVTKENDGLGKDIINLLVAQMNATLSMNHKNLYHYTLKIKNGK